MSWSWLPYDFNWSTFIPTFTPPVSIQRRFISFILRRTLGHLVKPGQLDVEQIDAQLGRGLVEINNVEFDVEAVNAHLCGIPCKLQHGSIGKISLNVPWANPLSATIGLSIADLDLVAYLTGDVKSSVSTDTGTLGTSVANAAETFMHDELDDGEEEVLRESVHEQLPGGFSSREPTPAQLNPFQTPSIPERLSEGDPEGISIFARLIERLLSRFNFGLTTATVKLLCPDQQQITLKVGSIQYSTEGAPGPGSNIAQGDSLPCQTRRLEISGVAVFVQQSHHDHSLPESSPVASDHAYSDSEMDEETAMMMSQSMLNIREQPHNTFSTALSTISSAASSMYESAISVAGEGDSGEPSQRLRIEQEHDSQTPHEYPLLTFVEPIVVQLTTPPPYVASAPLENEFESDAAPHQKVRTNSKLKLHISLGTVALSACAQTVRVATSLAGALQGANQPSDSASKVENAVDPHVRGNILDKLDFSLQCRAIAVLLHRSISCESSLDAISTFHSSPLSPPYINEGSLRILVDRIEAKASLSDSPSKSFSPPGSLQFASCTIADISILAFHSISPQSNTDNRMYSPILLMDTQLLSSYRSWNPINTTGGPMALNNDGTELPAIDVFDWTKGKVVGARVDTNHWKTGLYSKDSDNRAVCVDVFGPVRGSGTGFHSVVQTNLIHVFMDLSSVAIVASIAAEMAKGTSSGSRSEAAAENPPPNFPSSGGLGLEGVNVVDTDEYSTAQTHLERFILEDRQSKVQPPTALRKTNQDETKPPQRSVARASPMQININIPCVRFEARVPCERSGSLVLDLHKLSISLNEELVKKNRGPRFQDDPSVYSESEISDWLKGTDAGDVVAISFASFLAAYSGLDDPTAECFLLVSAEGDIHGSPYSLEARLNQLPLILLKARTKGEANAKSTSDTILVRIPNMQAAVSKAILDGLQIWADDATQSMERSLARQETSASGAGSTAASTVSSGSAGTRRSDASTAARREQPAEETIVKVVVHSASVCLRVPIRESSEIRFIEIRASGIDALAELNAEGQNQMIITLGIKGLSAVERNDGVSHQLIETINNGSNTPPVAQLRFQSSPVPGTNAKESYMFVAATDLTVCFWSEVDWLLDLAVFVKPPPGVFESVVPSDRTRLEIHASNCAVRVLPPTKPCVILLSLEEINFSTELSSHTTEAVATTVGAGLSILFLDDAESSQTHSSTGRISGLDYWKKAGYVLILHIGEHDIMVRTRSATGPPDNVVIVNSVSLQIHLCADTAMGIAVCVDDILSVLKPADDSTASSPVQEKRIPHTVTQSQSASTMLRSLDEQAFKQVPEIGPVADMISDDLPSNPEYIDASFGAAAGLRELTEEDLEEDYVGTLTREAKTTQASHPLVSTYGGETVTMLVPSLDIVEDYFDNLPPIVLDNGSGHASTIVRVSNCNVNVFLYDGYDWSRTRKSIQEQIKVVKRRLAKIRQLLASGQTYDPNADELNTTLFNSVYVGLDQDAAELKGDALAAAIDEELEDASDAASESSWQSFQGRPSISPGPSTSTSTSTRQRPSSSLNTRNLTRSRSPNIEFSIQGLSAEFDQYLPNQALVSKVLVTIRDFEILDHIRTSTWSKFLTAMMKDSKGNVRETDSNMVRVELQTLQPVRGQSDQEARLKAKILPLKLHVDQDALDFLKKFFSFSDPDAEPSSSKDEFFFQHVEVFPVDIKLDYKPRRVDYRALREGRTIELMNFFHFDGAEMTLRHITLKGVTGWARIGEILNDLWTPDVKANQLVDVISGVSPIRSAVNMGSGVADLVLLPIAQYKKDGRVIRGLQKGTNAFIKSTAMEALQLGARLATGTQVILEQAEAVLGGQYTDSVTAEALQVGSLPRNLDNLPPEGQSHLGLGGGEMISRYAEQPENIKEGVSSAYRTLSRNVKSAGQTILAVPMEVYEQAGKEGPARAVIRAVPIAVLKPMIGASEAVSQTLLGLRNSLEPSVHHENEVKYKHR